MHKLKPEPTKFVIFAFGCCIVAIFLAGCAALWQPAPDHMKVGAFSFKPPPGWMRLSTPSYDMFSIDGPYLQYILVQERPLNQAFRHTRRTLTQRLPPYEAAEIIIDNLRFDPQLSGFKLIASQPVTFSGRTGFKLLYTHKDCQGVTIRSLYYGFVLGNVFLNLRYTAAQRHYFDKNLKDFEQMVNSSHLPSRSLKRAGMLTSSGD